MARTTAPATQKTYQASAWHFAALLLGNVMLALGPWLVRLTDTGPVAAGFWRMPARPWSGAMTAVAASCAMPPSTRRRGTRRSARRCWP